MSSGTFTRACGSRRSSVDRPPAYGNDRTATKSPSSPWRRTLLRLAPAAGSRADPDPVKIGSRPDSDWIPGVSDRGDVGGIRQGDRHRLVEAGDVVGRGDLLDRDRLRRRGRHHSPLPVHPPTGPPAPGRGHPAPLTPAIDTRENGCGPAHSVQATASDDEIREIRRVRPLRTPAGSSSASGRPERPGPWSWRS